MSSASDPQSLINVFVYGTLKPGEAYYQTYCAEWLVASQEAIARGQLYALPMGYPAMTDGDSTVYGYLFSFADPHVLKLLDELEEYDPQRPAAQNEYDRQWIEVFNLDRQPLSSAWAYIMPPDQAIALGGILLPKGLWTGKDSFFDNINP